MTSNNGKQENVWISLLFNVALPTFILMKLSGTEQLGPEVAFATALSFPLAYGAWDFYSRRKFNFISALGFVSVLVKGGLGLMKLDGFWFAVNEAALPGIFGLALLISAYRGKPLVKMFLLNENLVDVSKIQRALEENNCQQKFEAVLIRSTYLLFLSFLVSAILNFVLAYYMLKSPSGTPEFNEELGRMTALSFPVIMICSSSIMIYALWDMLKQIKSLTGLELEAILKQQRK